MKAAYYLCLLGLLAVTPHLHAQSTPNPENYQAYQAADKTTIFFDDFNDNTNRWESIYGYQTKSIGGGYLHYKATFPNPIGIATIPLKFENKADFEIETELINQAGPYQFGLFFGGRSSGVDKIPEGIYFTISAKASSFLCYNSVNGKRNILVKTERVDAINRGNGTRNKLTVRNLGNKLYFFVNEVFVGSAGTPIFPGDETGFRNEVQLDVDYLRVSYLGDDYKSKVPAVASVPATQPTTTQPEAQAAPVQPKQQAPQSDVDLNIPATGKHRENAYALIIGNENYRKEIKVDYANNDARVFKQYLEKTMGVPAENIHLLLDGSYGDMLGEIAWLEKVGKALAGDAEIILYYAGHGMPDEGTQAAYLLPVDGSSGMLNVAVPIADVYKQLSKYPTKSTVVFLDACFSGGARDGMLASGRGIAIKPKTEALASNLVVFSAVTGEQTAHPYKEKSHGLFTYYLLKKIQDTKGDFSLQELDAYLKKEVTKQSILKNDKEQNPQVNVSPTIREQWGNWKLR